MLFPRVQLRPARRRTVGAAFDPQSLRPGLFRCTAAIKWLASGETTMSNDRFDIHQHITDQIITLIEQGPDEFRLPWHTGTGNIMRPTNAITKKRYRGVNILALWADSHMWGFTSGLWGTYRQWAEIGAQVRKGEKAAHVVFYKQFEINSQDAEDETETRLIARATPVFSAEQVDGFAIPAMPNSPDPVTTIDTAEKLIGATGASIAHGGNRAFYRPSTDSIHLPLRDVFLRSATSTATEAYYSTLFHELTHWTASEARCNRQLGKRFGDAAYAMEELIAELGAAFLCGELSITQSPRADHAQYLASWLAVLKADKKAIFTAASRASAAVDFISGHVP
jgi:antirestriction protein ArdC